MLEIQKTDLPGVLVPECDAGLNWSGPDLKINWPVGAKAAILSERDVGLGFFRDFVTPVRFEEGFE